jgi:type II secretory pathway component PulJ
MTCRTVKSPPGKSPPGFTLIEMITVISLSSFVLVSVAMAISSLHRLNRKLRDDLPAAANVTRLGLQFRSDVHASQQIEIVSKDPASPLLRFTLGNNRTIEYSSDQNRISRIVQNGGQTERREEFVLPPQSEFRFSIDSESSLATISVQRHTGQVPDGADDLHVTTITAAIGLDHQSR